MNRPVVTMPKKRYKDGPLTSPPIPFRWTHAQCRCCGLWWPLVFVPAGSPDD